MIDVGGSHASLKESAWTTMCVPAMLTRIKYVSRFAAPLSARDVEGIVDDSQRRNAGVGVTGALLTFGDVFMQFLEGPPAAVAAVLARIAIDPRHRDLVVLRRGDVDRRIFGEWSMRLLDVGDDARRETAPLLTRIESVAQCTALPTSALHDLDDLLWRTIGERGSRRAA